MYSLRYALRTRGMDARVVVEDMDCEQVETDARAPIDVRVERVAQTVETEDTPDPTQEGDTEVVYETLGDLVQRFHDHTEEIPIHRIQAIEAVQRDQGHRIMGAVHRRVAMIERISELERDNRRLRGMLSVESRRVARSQQREFQVRRELRQIRQF